MLFAFKDTFALDGELSYSGINRTESIKKGVAWQVEVKQKLS